MTRIKTALGIAITSLVALALLSLFATVGLAVVGFVACATLVGLVLTFFAAKPAPTPHADQ
jgi:hypothetical protein